MVLQRLFGFIARARAPDKEFSIIRHTTIPELSALAAAPEQVHAEGVSVQYDHTHHTLRVTLNNELVTFSFREDHILVFSEKPFSPKQFREELKAAATRQRASTRAVPRRFQERVSETVQ